MKSEFERRVIIKAKRLRKKKSLRDKIWMEQDKLISGVLNEDGTYDIKKTMSDYIKQAGDLSVKEIKEENEKKKEGL